MITIIIVTKQTLDAINLMHAQAGTVTQLHSSGKYPYILWLWENAADADVGAVQNNALCTASSVVKGQ